MIASHLCINSFGLAEDCTDKDGVTQTPTAPGNTEYPEDWRNQYRPTIYASDDEIAPEGTITLYVDSGCLACPPYSWSVSGEGYTIQDNDGDQETDNDLETITLTAPASVGVCGTDYDIVATVTVEDQLEETDSVKIKNTDGQWVYESTICQPEANGNRTYWSGAIGNYRYKVKFKSISGTPKTECDEACALELFAINDYFLLEDYEWWCDGNNYLRFYDGEVNHGVYGIEHLQREIWSCP